MVLTRILVISDTHGLKFPNPSMPFSRSLPSNIDLLIHTGDLTRSKHQTRAGYIDAISLLQAFPAKVKLVIAGNHDIALDPITWASWGGNPDFSTEMMNLMTGPQAKMAGIEFLSEGVHHFVLPNGAKVKIYASPYTPLWSDSAFKYGGDEDPYNPPSSDLPGCNTTPRPRNPIPDYPEIDILMTHGPPLALGPLDMTRRGAGGCSKLSRAVERAMPRLHVWGHLHDGYGAGIWDWEQHTFRPLSQETLRVNWDAENSTAKNRSKREQKAKIEEEKQVAEKSTQNPYPEATKCDIKFGMETVMINAANASKGVLPFGNQKLPWIIDLDLPLAQE